MNPRASIVKVLCYAGMAWMLTACNARVKEFSAVPRHICAGERVSLRWNVVGSANVTVTPPNSELPDGPVESTGQVTIAPTMKTVVALHVTRPLGEPTTSVQEIEVTNPSETAEVLAASMGDSKARPGCSSGKVWATVHVERFAADVKVATVASHPGDDRAYEVEHAGLHASVAPGTIATTFEGKPIAGDWLLTVPLNSGQTCATIPRNLVVNVITQCARMDHDSR
jgi:hypothetical protein